MATDRTNGRRLRPGEVGNIVRSLTLLDIDVADLEGRLQRGRALGPAVDNRTCIIDITCCIIDCTKCGPDERGIFENPANVLEGFLFRLPHEANNPDAPVYCVSNMDARSALRMGHGNLTIPGGRIRAHLVGVAAEVFETEVLTRHRIAHTAAVISLSPDDGQ